MVFRLTFARAVGNQRRDQRPEGPADERYGSLPRCVRRPLLRHEAAAGLVDGNSPPCGLFSSPTCCRQVIVHSIQGRRKPAAGHPYVVLVIESSPVAAGARREAVRCGAAPSACPVAVQDRPAADDSERIRSLASVVGPGACISTDTVPETHR